METEQIVQLITAVLGSSIITSLGSKLMNRYRYDRKAEWARSLHEEIQLAAKLEGAGASETEKILARFVRADIEARLLVSVVPSDRVTTVFSLFAGFSSLMVGLVSLGAVHWGISILLFAIAALVLSVFVLEFKQVNYMRSILLSLMRTDSDPPVDGLPKRYREWLAGSDSKNYTFGRTTKAGINPTVRSEVADLIRRRQRLDQQPSTEGSTPS